LPLSDEVERFNKPQRRHSACTINVNPNVNTATRESDEQFKTDKYLRYAVTDGDERLDFIPALFFTPSADNMAASWLRQHSDYDGGFWSYWIIPQGVGGNITPAAFSSSPRRPGTLRRKQSYRMRIPGNYFDGDQRRCSRNYCHADDNELAVMAGGGYGAGICPRL
jgi:hypothetical protein